MKRSHLNGLTMKRAKQPLSNSQSSADRKEEVRKWSVAKPNEFRKSHGIDFSGVVEKSSLVELALDAMDDVLLAQASSESGAGDGAEKEALAELRTSLEDLARLTPSQLAQTIPAAGHAPYFRQNPQRLCQAARARSHREAGFRSSRLAKANRID